MFYGLFRSLLDYILVTFRADGQLWVSLCRLTPEGPSHESKYKTMGEVKSRKNCVGNTRSVMTSSGADNFNLQPQLCVT